MQSFFSAKIALFSSLAILVGGTSRVVLADEPGTKRTAKQNLDELRRYLPVLLRKSLLENDQELARSIEEFVKLAKGLREGGDASQAQVDAVERQLLQARIRLLERQTDYQNALDEFKLRFPGDEKRLDRFAKVAFLPVRQQLEQFRKLSLDWQALVRAINASSAAEKAPKLRADWRGLLSSAGLFKGTKLRDELPLRWAGWEKLAANDLNARLDKLLEERRKLLDKLTELEVKDQAPAAADRKRLNAVETEIDLGEFERNLREHEGQPWKQVPKAEQQHRLQQKSFRGLMTGFVLVIGRVQEERLIRLKTGWPKFPGIVIDQTDMLTVNRDKAEQALAARLKTPEARMAVKKTFRQARLLAEVYPLRQRVFELSYGEFGGAWDRAFLPAEGLAQQDVWRSFQAAFQAERTLMGAADELYRTWFNYQSSRLDLFHDLDITPP